MRKGLTEVLDLLQDRSYSFLLHCLLKQNKQKLLLVFSHILLEEFSIESSLICLLFNKILITIVNKNLLISFKFKIRYREKCSGRKWWHSVTAQTTKGTCKKHRRWSWQTSNHCLWISTQCHQYTWLVLENCFLRVFFFLHACFQYDIEKEKERLCMNSMIFIVRVTQFYS